MESESGGGHFPRVFRLIQGPSIPESNQRGKRNKNHMNPVIQLKKATPLFVIALVLACFALSPQAFAGTVKPPTFIPNQWSGCHDSTNVRISTGTSGASIKVWGFGAVGREIANNTTIPVGPLGSLTLWARAKKGNSKSIVVHSGIYRRNCP